MQIKMIKSQSETISKDAAVDMFFTAFRAVMISKADKVNAGESVPFILSRNHGMLFRVYVRKDGKGYAASMLVIDGLGDPVKAIGHATFDEFDL